MEKTYRDIDIVRRENLGIIVREVGGNRALADLLGRSESQVSQLLNGSKHFKSNKQRGMRKETARKIEQAVGKPIGWLDIDHKAMTNEPPREIDMSRIDSLEKLARTVGCLLSDDHRCLSDTDEVFGTSSGGRLTVGDLRLAARLSGDL